VSSRSYLSIGDVLTLLRQEFPDVTISKIWFLESQGLVNPERTPSGYRKFYEHDVERLRWVLRQQRENFLPLKVIKDRLDDDANGASGAEAPAASGASKADESGEPAARVRSTSREEPVLVGQRSSSAASAPASERGAPASGGSLPGIDSTGHPSRTSRSPAAVRAEQTVAGTSATEAAARVPPERSAETPQPGAPDPVEAKRPVSRAPRPETASTSEADPRRSGGSRPSGDAAPASSPPAAPRPDVGGVSLSLEELSAACGLDEEVLRELQEYGLLTATPVAGLDYFDQEAVAVATVAAGLARFGVEPRHLRLYKNAADREAGFVEQIVLPLVRQRNPDARAKAHQTAEELAGLGQQLRASLLRVALRGLLDG
jgi:DNA-binding transcriptional MerR regulator